MIEVKVHYASRTHFTYVCTYEVHGEVHTRWVCTHLVKQSRADMIQTVLIFKLTPSW